MLRRPRPAIVASSLHENRENFPCVSLFRIKYYISFFTAFVPVQLAKVLFAEETMKVLLHRWLARDRWKFNNTGSKDFFHHLSTKIALIPFDIKVIQNWLFVSYERSLSTSLLIITQLAWKYLVYLFLFRGQTNSYNNK